MGNQQSSLSFQKLSNENQYIYSTLLKQTKNHDSVQKNEILFTNNKKKNRISISNFYSLSTNNILVKESLLSCADQQNSQKVINDEQDNTNPKVRFQELTEIYKQYKICINLSENKKTLITNYFQDEENMESFVSNLIKLKQKDIELFQQFQIQNTQALYLVTRSFAQPLDLNKKVTQQALRDNQTLLFGYLSFIGTAYHQFSNIMFSPKDIFYTDSTFRIANFSYSQASNVQLLKTSIFWIFDQYKRQFQECLLLTSLNQDQMLEHPIYIKQLFKSLSSQKITKDEVSHYIQTLKQKALSLNNNIDSLNACLFYKKTLIFQEQKHPWIFAKKHNQLFFYNTQDKHRTQIKLVRKKKRIDLSSAKIIFDPEQLDIKYIAQNSKLIIHANQFQLQNFTSISDIQIKYKLPIKFKNPWVFLKQQTNELIILQNYVYRYNIRQNKIYQQSKKISDLIFLCKNKEYSYMIIKNSIDIFKNGIRIFFNYEDIQLNFVANPVQIEQLKNIRVDLRQVQFCKQIYRRVYLMFANKNLWILDLNFNIFFSFATIERVKEFYGFGISNQNKDFAFQIINQPFKVEFLTNQQGNNIKLKNSQFHIIGQMSGNYYYFKYQLIPQAGYLKLIKYSPMFGSIHKAKEDFMKTQGNSIIQEIISSHVNLKKNAINQSKKKQMIETKQKDIFEYSFNFHEQNLRFYKQQKWFFQGQFFLTPLDFKLHQNKNNFKITLTLEQVKSTFKTIIQQMKKSNQIFKPIEVFMLITKFLTIFQWLFKNKVLHKNISVNNLYITKQNQIKLIGWSQSSRNWFVSDYKDLLLVFFNIITVNTLQKLTDKLLQKHYNELSLYPPILQKLSNSLKSAKTVQKKVQIQKQIGHLKEYALRQLSNQYEEIKECEFLFSFEYNTPRLSMVSLKQKSRMKKIIVILDQNSKQQIIFRSSDKYLWKQNPTEKVGSLYIFTTNYNFYEIRISYNSFKQQTIVSEQYQYLPNNILESTLIYVSAQHSAGIYSFGGVFKTKNSSADISFCRNIYKFNDVKLTWESIGLLPEAKINPKLVLSKNKDVVYILGGQISYSSNEFRIIKFNLKNRNTQSLIDSSIISPFKQINNEYPFKIFNLSQEFNVFLIFSISQDKYQLRLFSCTTFGYDILLQTRNFSDQNKTISNLGITLICNNIHILRQYGKYTKLQINKLQTLLMTNQTFYPDRQQN